MARTARSEGFLKFAAVSQGTGADAAKLVVLGNDEVSGHSGGGEIMKHLSLITDISKSLTFDGWVVIVLCAILAVVGWVVAIGKLLYLNRISRSNAAFLERWEDVSSDLTVLDQEDENTIKTLGGTASGKAQKLMKHSPLYHIYHLGSEEMQKRLQNVRQISLSSTQKYAKGLSGRSIQAIKATLHGGLVREVQKLNDKLVFLTIGIAGGPYLGLLGTVIGVMITFAVIAKSGQVEVNSIAPGIAGALLATVAGLAVAIPALFAYSYLSTRIKDVVSSMRDLHRRVHREDGRASQGDELTMQADNKSYDDINVTPMVDLYLVLLLIFIIMTTAGVQGVKVNLPKASAAAAKKMDAPKMQAITVDNQGTIKLNATQVSSLAELEQKLGAIKAATPEFPVVVRGDSQTQYQAIMDVLDVLGRVGITQVGLATKPAGK